MKRKITIELLVDATIPVYMVAMVIPVLVPDIQDVRIVKSKLLKDDETL